MGRPRRAPLTSAFSWKPAATVAAGCERVTLTPALGVLRHSQRKQGGSGLLLPWTPRRRTACSVVCRSMVVCCVSVIEQSRSGRWKKKRESCNREKNNTANIIAMGGLPQPPPTHAPLWDGGQHATTSRAGNHPPLFLHSDHDFTSTLPVLLFCQLSSPLAAPLARVEAARVDVPSCIP